MPRQRVALAVGLLIQLMWSSGDAAAQRRQLGPGDKLPEVHLPSLTSDGTLSLRAADEGLAFSAGQDAVTHPKAAIVFFVRY